MRRMHRAVFHHPGPKPLPQQLEHPPIRDPLRHELHQLLVVDLTEVVPDIRVEHVVSTPAPSQPQGLQGIRGATLRPESVGARTKVRLENRLQHQSRRRLHHTISNGGDAQRSLPSISLRNVSAPHRRGPIPACSQHGFELTQHPLVPVLLDCRERLSIHTRGTAIPLHPPPCFAQDVTPAHAVVQRMEASFRLPLGYRPQPPLELSHFSMGSRPRGKLGPVLPAMPSRLPPPTAPSPQGSFPPVAFFVATLNGTTIPSASRCTSLDFAFGLFEPPFPAVGCTAGPLLFRTEP